MNLIMKYPLRTFDCPVPPIKRVKEPEPEPISEETKRRLLEMAVARATNGEK